MNTRKSLPWLVLVIVGYILLIGALFHFLPAPWNWVISILVVFKASLFLWAMSRASTIGTRRPPSSRA
ncbi:MAG TPA: hypothetical protein VGK74_19945 [Symbiobacteriaceae bacterium]|jgi:hypothetical protein